MSLIDAIKAHYTEENSPPSGPDLDYVLVDGKWVPGDTTTELMDSINLSKARWGTWFQNVYRRDDEFVAVKDCRPATEYQDWGDYGKPEIYPVVPRVVIVESVVYDRDTTPLKETP